MVDPDVLTTESSPENKQNASIPPEILNSEARRTSPLSWLNYSTFRVVFSIVLIIVVLGGGFALAGLLASLREPPTRSEPMVRLQSVEVYQAQVVDVQEMIIGYGTARAMQEVILSAQVAGEITETIQPLKIGQSIVAADMVKDEDGITRRTGGDLIARIDPDTYQERVDQARDLLNEDQVELNRVQQEAANLKRRLNIQEKNFSAFQKEYDRVANLVKQGIGTPSDLTQAELDLRKYEDAMVQLETQLALIPSQKNSIEARIKTRQNDLELALLELERTQVTSPINGQLAEINVEQGQYVRIGDPLVTITNTTQVEIPVGISQQDYLKIIPRIRRQDYPTATLFTNSNRSARWTGKITRAAPAVDVQTRTVEVFVVVDNTEFDAPLLPGTFVNVQIEGPVYEDILPIPRDAVFQNQIYVVRDGKAISREIVQLDPIQTLGLVKSGLENGEQVILTNLDILSDGDAIRVANDETQTLQKELERSRIPYLKVLSSDQGN